MAGGRGQWEEADTCFFSYSDFPSSQQAHGLEGILPATCHCAQEPGGLPSPRDLQGTEGPASSFTCGSGSADGLLCVPHLRVMWGIAGRPALLSLFSSQCPASISALRPLSESAGTACCICICNYVQSEAVVNCTFFLQCVFWNLATTYWLCIVFIFLPELLTADL